MARRNAVEINERDPGYQSMTQSNLKTYNFSKLLKWFQRNEAKPATYIQQQMLHSKLLKIPKWWYGWRKK